MHPILKVVRKSTRLAIGLMSGTSVDGIDAALVEISNDKSPIQVKLHYYVDYPYPVGLKEKILELSTTGKGTVDQICKMNAILGECFAEAVKFLLEKSGTAAESVDFIGSHGQTFQHLPSNEKAFGFPARSTLQLGDPSIIAKRTGIITVGDFRPADMALGGQGAPLVPYFDYLLFNSPDLTRVLVNLGGICNLTVLQAGGDLSDLVAYDTGPGNMVIDYLMQKLFHQDFDAEGAVATRGTISHELLTEMMKHPYFSQKPPKSTGREMFGANFAEFLLQKSRALQLPSEDLIATAAQITVATLADNIQAELNRCSKIDQIILSGGGTRNLFIRAQLEKRFPDTKLQNIDDYGISSESKEAVCFAVLANETIAGKPGNVPAATGAREATVLGKICF